MLKKRVQEVVFIWFFIAAMVTMQKHLESGNMFEGLMSGITGYVY